MPAPSPSSAVGTALPPGHKLAPCYHHSDAGVADPSQLLFVPSAVLLHPAECSLLPPLAQAGEPRGETQEAMVRRSFLQPCFMQVKAAKFNGSQRVAEELRSGPMLYTG